MLRGLVFYIAIICLWVSAKPPVISQSRMPSDPYISGDGFRAMADHVFDETDASLQPLEIAYGDIVFVKTDMLENFFTELHPLIKEAYILVSHNADHHAPGEFENYLNDSKILRWFAQNPTILHHSKFEAIPIGINNRYISDMGNVQNFFSLEERLKANPVSKPFLVGINFRVRTNKDVRQELFDLFAHRPYSQQLFAETHSEYLWLMSQAKFILCPRGNGLDCHRTWEAIIAGAIPILFSSCLDELLSDLPVLIVQNWQQIDERMLEQVYVEIQNSKARNIAKVTYDYWYQRIKGLQINFREGYSIV